MLQNNTPKVLPIVLVELILQSPAQRSKPPTANIIDWSSQSHPRVFGIIYRVARCFYQHILLLSSTTLFPHP